MSNAGVFENYFNNVRLRVGQGWDGVVRDKMGDIKRELDREVANFFPDVAKSFGGDEAPPEIGVGWEDLSEDWVLRKFKGTAKKNKKAPLFKNRFYVGLKGKMQKFLASKDARKLYGEPTVTISEGIGAGFSNASGRLRIAKNFKGAGRFASLSSAMQTTLSIVPFPKLFDLERADEVFKGKMGIKIGAGEHGADGRPARPFLWPFVRYYQITKIPQMVNRVISR